MRHFFNLLILAAVLTTSLSVRALSDHAMAKKDIETQFIILEFPKFEKVQIQQLLSELHMYPGKITDAQFDFEAHQLTVLYLSTIRLDDILEIVSKYNMDFTKFSGSEVQ